MIDAGIWNWNKPHHLLGCSLAKEFRYYINHNVFNIVSCDTSNPIVAALHGMKYDADYGLQTKPSTKLADLIDHQVTKDEMDHFKKIWTSETLTEDDKENLWKWFKLFLDIAIQYDKVRNRNKNKT